MCGISGIISLSNLFGTGSFHVSQPFDLNSNGNSELLVLNSKLKLFIFRKIFISLRFIFKYLSLSETFSLISLLNLLVLTPYILKYVKKIIQNNIKKDIICIILLTIQIE